jgi:hypothetical protein
MTEMTAGEPIPIVAGDHFDCGKTTHLTGDDITSVTMSLDFTRSGLPLQIAFSPGAGWKLYDFLHRHPELRGE